MKENNQLKNLWESRGMIVIGIMVVLFALASYLSFTSIRQQQGNARVINYVGIVRGATQKLVKSELQGYPDDALIARLDSIVLELMTGDGPNHLIKLEDGEYLELMGRVSNEWMQIKTEIQNVREGADEKALFILSEDYFNLVDKTVSAAERFSENQVRSTSSFLIGVNAVFILVILVGLVYYIRTAAIERRAEMLGKIAYVDPLVQMPNRASCEKRLDELQQAPPEGDMAFIMFDMNNLKLVNDNLGHQGGDRVIAEFARILKNEAADYGYICRYGGDEFLGMFENADEAMVERFITRINEKVVSYNLLHVNELEKLSFAVGYAIDNIRENAVGELISEADRKMYLKKRQMKENRD